MSLEAIAEQYIPKEESFYSKYYAHIVIVLMVLICLLMAVTGVLFYQLWHRPTPVFIAQQANGKKMTLTAFEEPNLLADTIVRWASKAAISAYTFNFSNYKQQLAALQPYFTEDGWQKYLIAVSGLMNRIVKSQLFVNSIVVGAPVIANQGSLPNKGEAWRVQIPFLVTYQSANITRQENYMVVLTIVRVPTSTNPQGIGIDQFKMV